MRNLRQTTKEELITFLKSLDSKLSHKITFIAVGGTALTLLNLKESTKDIDFDIPFEKDKKALFDLFIALGFEKESFAWFTPTGLRIDTFEKGYIFCIQLLHDYIQKSKTILELENITLKILNLEDIIITKCGRGDERDFEDIKRIYETNQIDNWGLAERYLKTNESSPDSPQKIKQRFLDLIENKFRQWKLPLDHKLIEQVKKWEI